jgi:excisionase family DNA binding protein
MKTKTTKRGEQKATIRYFGEIVRLLDVRQDEYPEPLTVYVGTDKETVLPAETHAFQLHTDDGRVLYIHRPFAGKRVDAPVEIRLLRGQPKARARHDWAEAVFENGETESIFVRECSANRTQCRGDAGGDMLTIQEAAEYANVSERTIRDWLERNDGDKPMLPGAIKTGRLRRIPRADLDPWRKAKKDTRTPRKRSRRKAVKRKS